MFGADGGDLADVVAAVDEVETAPLVEAERAEDHVADGTATVAEELLGDGDAGVHRW